MRALNGALDPGPGAVVLVVLAPSTLPFAYVTVVLHNFYSAYPLEHLEAELGFHLSLMRAPCSTDNGSPFIS